MPEGGENSIRWLETTSKKAATPTSAEAANNIPLQRGASRPGGSKIGFLDTTTKATSATTTKSVITKRTTEATESTTTTAADDAVAAEVVTEDVERNSCSDSEHKIIINRITAIPGRTQTQTAKISYRKPQAESPAHSSSHKLVRPPTTTTTMVQRLHTDATSITTQTPRTTSIPNDTGKSSSSIEEFNKKKSEREQEIREIQNMLKEIAKDPMMPPKSSTEPMPPKSSTNSPEQPQQLQNVPEETTKPTPTSPHHTSFQRSKTDLQLIPIKAATTRRNPVRTSVHGTRSKSSQLPATKSAELLLPESPCKKKPYNREETRRFMEEQRKKRRSTAAEASTALRAAMEKEEIKKRLEELRKNTRKIVSKNLKNAQKRTGGGTEKTGTGTLADEASPKKTAKMEIIFKRPAERKTVKQNKDTESHDDNDKLSLEIHKPKMDVVEEYKKQSSTVKPDNGKNNALLENQKRIGLLRKPELKDHSFSAIKEFSFDKENVALEMLTPVLTVPLEPRIKDKGHQSEPVRDDPISSVQQKPLEPAKSSAQLATPSMKSTNDLNLEMPSTRLRTRTSVRETGTQVKDSPSLMADDDGANPKERSNHRSDLPYWLKPSAVQVYPYNFIMAVRRKLEAIANPPHLPTTLISPTKNKTTSTRDLCEKKPLETPVSSVPKDRVAEAQQNVKRRLMTTNVEDSFATHTIEHHPKKEARAEKKLLSKELSHKRSNENLLKSHTLSDLTSNFSSISLQLPVSNTVSEVSSLKSESNRHASPKKMVTYSAPQTEDDDTTVSSSIFNSPEKKMSNTKSQENIDHEFVAPRPVSPLSLERIDNLKITSKAKLKEAIASKHVNAYRGDHLQKSASHKGVQRRAPENSEVGVNFNRLLDDFNRSLSQVIEVNEQLKSTLDKSHQIFSPERKRNPQQSQDDQDRAADEYTTDFEPSSGKAKSMDSNIDAEEVLKHRTIEMQKSLQLRKKSLFELTNAVKPLLSSSQTATDSGTTEGDVPKLELNLESVAHSTDSSPQSKANLSTESELERQDQEASEDQSSARSADSLDKRLQTIEQLKENLKQSIFNSKVNRENSESPSKRNEPDVEKRNEPDVEEEKHKKTYSPALKKSETQSDTEKGALNQIRSPAKLKMHISNSRPRSNQTSFCSIHSHEEPMGQSPSRRQNLNTGQRSTSSATVDSNKRTIRESPTRSSTTEQSVIETALSENSSPMASAQLTDASPKLSSSRNNNRSQSPHSAEVSYHLDTKSNSPKARTFLISNNSQRSHSPIQKSTDFDERSISEELQIESESPSKENKAAGCYQSPESKNRSPQKSFMNKSHDSSVAEYSPNKTQSEFIKSHVNNSRGDFFPMLDENAVSNESHFQAAAATSPRNNPGNSSSSTDSIAPPSYNAVAHKFTSPSRSAKKPKLASTSALGQEIIAVFNQSDIELSIVSSHNGSVSETSMNYSSVGVYEKLIQSETTKSEHLTALLKMREKALLDRTKGQIAWLEVQKERYKAKGLVEQISAIKKKQRAILLKMEKEREEIKRLLQSTTTTTTTTSGHSTARPQATGTGHQTSPQRKRSERDPTTKTTPKTAPPVLLPLPILPKSTRSQHQQQHHQQQHTLSYSAPIVRANYELESSRSLEELLQKREADLRRRREHVERLMQWHQRLDQEEAEVLQLERMLLNCNNAHAHRQQDDNNGVNEKHTEYSSPSRKHKQLEKSAEHRSSERSPQKRQRHTREEKMERRLKEIDRSLRELSSISTSNNNTTTAVSDESGGVINGSTDFVRTTGNKLNKLWRRLTSQQVEKFEPNRRYKLCKSDLEKLYEEAKVAVLRDFTQDEERVAVELLDKTSTTLSSNQSQLEFTMPTNKVTIPRLNLNFSSGQSEADEAMLEEADESVAEASTHSSLPQGNYSPSAAEEDFIMQEDGGSSSKQCRSPVSNSDSEIGSGRVVESEHEAMEEVEREQLIERNVQKFLALTQRFNGSQNDGLQRSLSDTQISENGVVSKKSNKSSGISQRNIAYYGVKTQKKPSKVVNVEIANSLSTASSLFSANTLQSVQSLPLQSGSEKVSRTHNSPDAISSQSASNESASKVTSDIPLPSSDSNEIGNETKSIPPAKSTLKSEAPSNTDASVKTAESLPSVNTAPSLIETDLKSTHSTDFGNKSSSASTLISTANSSAKSRHALSSTSKDILTKADPSAETQNNTIPSPSVANSATVETNSNATAQKSTFSAQHTVVSDDVDSKAKEISAKLEEISLAVTMLSQSNSLPTTGLSSQPQELLVEQSTNSPTIENSTVDPPSASPSVVDEITTAADETNLSPDATSYSCNFENINTDLQSPSGCTLKSASSLDTNTLVQSSSPQKEEKSTAPSAPSLSNVPDALASMTFVSTSVGESQSATENRLLDKYEDDFEDGDETCLDDISLPQFETTVETTQEEEEETTVNEENKKGSSSTLSNEKSPPQKKVSESRDNLPPPPPPPPQQVPTTSKDAGATSSNSTNQQQQLMPDIINELEVRRSQPAQAQAQPQYEHVTAVPSYMYVREIPNKPPPPYVPPAHGSPMTTIFPSEERIRDITYRRTHELYCELLKTEYTNEKGEKLPSVMEEKITNIYERIILDICREYLDEHKEALTKSDPTSFYSQLAFFNPPDRLRCLQTFVYKEVRRCLAMEKKQPKRSQVYSVYGQRAKRDHIGKIIIQEMYDEDNKWCNFHREENEVLDLIIEEMVLNDIKELAKEVLIEEGGTVEDEQELDESEDTQLNGTAAEQSQQNESSQSQMAEESYSSKFDDAYSNENKTVDQSTKSSTPAIESNASMMSTESTPSPPSPT